MFCYNMSRKWVVSGDTRGIKEVFLIEAMKTCLSVIEMIERREKTHDAKEGLWGTCRNEVLEKQKGNWDRKDKWKGWFR